MWVHVSGGLQYLHCLGWHEGEVGHEHVKADDVPHRPHKALPCVLGDVLRNVCMVGNYQRDGQQLCVQRSRKHQQPCTELGLKTDDGGYLGIS